MAELETAAIESLRQTNKSWSGRHVYVWLNDKLILSNSPRGATSSPPPLPSYLKPAFADVVRHHDKLSLRASETIPTASGDLTVLSSEPLDRNLLEELATDLGEITLYASGLTLHKIEQPESASSIKLGANGSSPRVSDTNQAGVYVLDTGKDLPAPTITTGSIPSPTRAMDRQVQLRHSRPSS